MSWMRFNQPNDFQNIREFIVTFKVFFVIIYVVIENRNIWFQKKIKRTEKLPIIQG